MKNPMIVAAIALVITVIAYRMASKISNKFLRSLGQLASVLGTMALIGAVSGGDPQSASQWGQYYAGGIIAYVILGKLIGKSGEDS